EVAAVALVRDLEQPVVEAVLADDRNGEEATHGRMLPGRLRGASGLVMSLNLVFRQADRLVLGHAKGVQADPMCGHAAAFPLRALLRECEVLARLRPLAAADHRHRGLVRAGQRPGALTRALQEMVDPGVELVSHRSIGRCNLGHQWSVLLRERAGARRPFLMADSPLADR